MSETVPQFKGPAIELGHGFTHGCTSFVYFCEIGRAHV